MSAGEWMLEYLAKSLARARGFGAEEWRQCVPDARMAMDILSGPGATWHALQVQCGMETRVASDLRRQGYHEFVAFSFERREIGSNVIPWPVLRFPGYLFVQIDYGRKQEFRPVIETLGVIDVLSIGNLGKDGIPQPSEVPNYVIEVFRWDQIEDYDQASRRVRRAECGYSVGARILAHRGPWEGQEFTVKESRPGRVTVELPNGWPLPLLEADIMPATGNVLRGRSMAHA